MHTYLERDFGNRYDFDQEPGVMSSYSMLALMSYASSPVDSVGFCGRKRKIGFSSPLSSHCVPRQNPKLLNNIYEPYLNR